MAETSEDSTVLFRLGQIQMAVFLSYIEQSSRLKIASHVIEAVPGLSGVDPMILPLPKDAPPEFPQIEIRNEQEGWLFRFATGRWDLFYSPKQLDRPEDFPQALDKIQDSTLQLWDVFENKLSAHSNRLGLVVSFEAELENAAQELRRRYINPDFAQDAKEVQFHYLQNTKREDFDLNRWVRLLNQSKQEGTPEVLLMLVDVNTVAERPLEKVDITTVQRFLKVASELVEENLTLHSGVQQ